MTFRTPATLFACLLLAATTAQAADNTDTQKPSGGTVKGAVIGGVAGHELGGHTKTGAAVGALAGHHEKAESQKNIEQGKQP